MSRARLHSSGAAAARAYKTGPEPAADTAEVAATVSYDELLDARYVRVSSGLDRTIWHSLTILDAQAYSKSALGQLASAIKLVSTPVQ